LGGSGLLRLLLGGAASTTSESDRNGEGVSGAFFFIHRQPVMVMAPNVAIMMKPMKRKTPLDSSSAANIGGRLTTSDISISPPNPNKIRPANFWISRSSAIFIHLEEKTNARTIPERPTIAPAQPISSGIGFP
jgi:hypothetical protein